MSKIENLANGNLKTIKTLNNISLTFPLIIIANVKNGNLETIKTLNNTYMTFQFNGQCQKWKLKKIKTLNNTPRTFQFNDQCRKPFENNLNIK